MNGFAIVFCARNLPSFVIHGTALPSDGGIVVGWDNRISMQATYTCFENLQNLAGLINPPF